MYISIMYVLVCMYVFMNVYKYYVCTRMYVCTLIDYQIHIKTGRNNVVSVMLISVLNIKVTCE